MRQGAALSRSVPTWFHQTVTDPERSESVSSEGAQERPRPPHRLGRYRILDEVASGGMATLYLAATDGPAGYEKMVALKRIHPHLASDRRYLDMFLDEARLAARIVHPNVCGVIDFGESEGQHFLAMDFLSGVTLSELLRTVARSGTLRADPVWLPVIGRILCDAAEGLHAAHELRDAHGKPLGVVHRDVSPQNLFVGFDGSTRVLDFGVAAAADRIHHTATGEVKGKFAYMAPEQVKHAEPDRRIDVWALGVVAWEALTLRRLFRRAATAGTLYAVLEEHIERPSVLSPRLPAELDAPILAALARDRQERTQSTRELAEGLRGALAASGARLAEPSEVAAFVRRALPDHEDSLRSRIASARARRTLEPEPATSVTEARGLSARALTIAVLCLAVLGLAVGAWGVHSLSRESAPQRGEISELAPDTTPRVAVGPPREPPPEVPEPAIEPAGAEVRSEPTSPPPPRRRVGGRTGRGQPSDRDQNVDLAREW